MAAQQERNVDGPDHRSYVDRQMTIPSARLLLEDGQEIVGRSFGANVSISGEVVFNTGMVGYPESLSDPSYRGQILVITYPLVGNYGVPKRDELDSLGLPKHFESSKVQCSAVVISDYSYYHSHYSSNSNLSEWLKEQGVPGIYNVDTRALTKKLRNHGSMLGKVVMQGDDAGKMSFEDPNKRNLAAEVSRKAPAVFKPPSGDAKFHVVAVDCGMKNNIIRYLVNHCGCSVKVVPWNHDITTEECDGVFLSNGPGDPSLVDVTVQHVRKLLDREPPIPIFGICLGNQILARAAGATTYKMKFGNRGMNQPVIDCRTTRCYITPQNHGFAVDEKTLPKDWCPLFYNANDLTNEGIIHRFKPHFSAQFHPEHMGGPSDTAWLFDLFLQRIRDRHAEITTVLRPIDQQYEVKKVLLLGSGGLSIGQAGEFDYSGSQAIKALKEHNLKVVLVNPNIATVQTSRGMADKTYFEPVTPEIVESIIIKERPDSIMLQFGGQTALNCGVKLNDSGVLSRYGVRVLGTPVEAITATEDREIFADKLAEIGEKVAQSQTATTVKAGLDVARAIGYPVLVRSAFALGGLGSGFASNDAEMEELAAKALASSPQIIVDKSLKGWKEVEYEVVRDSADNCITVCNMENFDPLGVHTGDSIVVAPSQTLSNADYYRMRLVAIKVARKIGIVGECNIQYAMDPNSDDYCIIEMNARLSRSSALASKATGYPLAYVAAKLALGYKLTDIKNSVTRVTCACFEPSLDYCVVKFPRWDMRKFSRVSTAIGSAMKSVGEVMAIGRKFEETFMKALRMVDPSVDGFGDLGRQEEDKMTDADIEAMLSNPSDRRVFAIGAAMNRGWGIERIWALSKIDKWFLCKLRNIIDMQTYMGAKGKGGLTEQTMRMSKQLGFSDAGIARITKSTETEIRDLRKQQRVRPVVKQIDTLAAEFPAQTNYLYTTYNGDEDDLVFDEHGVMVLGCGPYRIGSSVEFDWCAVSCLRTLASLGIKSIVVNYNPETVSTDYDESNRLYFEELSLESVLGIYEREQSRGVVVCVGGQLPNNLVLPLHANNVRILGTSPESIDTCEDRNKFSQLCDKLDIDQPDWTAVTSIPEAKAFARRVEYPVLVRPSYVLSGAAMRVIEQEEDLEGFLKDAADVSREHPVVLSKFVTNAKEIEMDAVAVNGKIVNYAVSEHVENAGVHSGDATLVLPAQRLYVETVRRVKRITGAICQRLNITGPVNCQFLSKMNDIKVIECNLRASRSFPFVSKTFNANFIELATKAMVGRMVTPFNINLYDTEWVCSKSAMFSFGRLLGADPITRVEMASTGEVACFGFDQHEALVKSLLATNFKLPTRTRAILISVGPEKAKVDFLGAMKSLAKMGYQLFCTPNTHKYYSGHGVPCERVRKPDSADEDEGTGTDSPTTREALAMIAEKQVDIVIDIPRSFASAHITSGYRMRRAAVDYGVSLLTNLKLARALVLALEHVNIRRLPVRHWDEYVVPGLLGESEARLAAWQTPLHSALHTDPQPRDAAGRPAVPLSI
eukprot:TRINITY_DN4352_c0_g1_i1.p1 TRINITY_DN4352_c0_g1~~TRINITY_DN4352_c0_g1_i1.p1  ORF type:complete len:1525 (+),score=622.04 TRINITY_DN4352_c0_g1_i1:128-4702(+)